MNEAIQLANDRPTSLNDDLYQWATDAESMIRSQAAEIERLRSVLEQLARLGNGDKYGNSIGNQIAREALGVKHD